MTVPWSSHADYWTPSVAAVCAGPCQLLRTAPPHAQGRGSASSLCPPMSFAANHFWSPRWNPPWTKHCSQLPMRASAAADRAGGLPGMPALGPEAAAAPGRAQRRPLGRQMLLNPIRLCWQLQHGWRLRSDRLDWPGPSQQLTGHQAQLYRHQHQVLRKRPRHLPSGICHPSLRHSPRMLLRVRRGQLFYRLWRHLLQSYQPARAGVKRGKHPVGMTLRLVLCYRQLRRGLRVPSAGSGWTSPVQHMKTAFSPCRQALQHMAVSQTALLTALSRVLNQLERPLRQSKVAYDSSTPIAHQLCRSSLLMQMTGEQERRQASLQVLDRLFRARGVTQSL